VKRRADDAYAKKLTCSSVPTLLRLQPQPEYVAHHVAGDVGRGEFLAQLVQRSTIIVGMVMMYLFALPIPGSCLCSTIGSRSPISEAYRFSLSGAASHIPQRGM
jgi:hypothetical protein